MILVSLDRFTVRARSSVEYRSCNDNSLGLECLKLRMGSGEKNEQNEPNQEIEREKIM